jgi:hypothetical protein
LNGQGNSQVYRLDALAETDNGHIIDSRYTTAGLPELSKRAQLPGLGPNRVRWDYLVASMNSGGNVQVRLYPNRLVFPEPLVYDTWTVPGGITPGQGLDDAEQALNFAGTRTYVEFRENDGHGFSLSGIALHGEEDAWNVVRGRTGVRP